MSVVSHWPISQPLDWSPVGITGKAAKTSGLMVNFWDFSYIVCIYKSFNKRLMGEIGVGGCTFPEHRVQPWDVPYPHDLWPTPPTGRVFSRGAAAGLRLKLLFLHAAFPSCPYPSSQAFPAPFPPKGFWELIESTQAPSSPVFLKDPPPTAPSYQEGRGAGLSSHCLLP